MFLYCETQYTVFIFVVLVLVVDDDYLIFRVSTFSFAAHDCLLIVHFLVGLRYLAPLSLFMEYNPNSCTQNKQLFVLFLKNYL